ncbi:MAG: 3-dehydroquinate synthase [Candidatus Lambdaproteobacteria bacterium RIFOXYD1_FULL_56_27]|uniref:3-dehydroquinate synthase n=1 Tax=Candidatus Lambdaproteobacteria bacterium RIFOXYD2_FULL_56_26 TaxID=1817773 RepID=A0A1F6GUU2_9PROT|nr:MAG: 3-dehydroquinate synthase [Candidatus Lambdaproteobacteria bacterium RIFOXYD2_FULL_56_26]OGH02304.1 MAG: 3-dehydroquinate synthase [Candidatus Lambdaproteobacteria bacterium RIFOXYC1_FULL_56_13]OGH10075.1 MAG: 3-dehydroquinate synthase [Candidatus Lambdaproteobacteria bacterium RIFOXYD1_FULL_56_27]
MSKTIQISLSRLAYQYSVQIGSGILTQGLKDLLHKEGEKQVMVITNEVVDSLYPQKIESCLPEGYVAAKLVLPDGEKTKNLETLSKIYDFLAQRGANRKSLLIAFGGGVIGDMGGFAAATYMRGINFIQVPTTLLSQVDSSIGGKTAVNHPLSKNSIGAFKQPLGTLIDVDFLATLADREFVAGYAELLKHALIADPYLNQMLKKQSLSALHQDPHLLIEVITRSCQVKANVVEQDEQENSVRALLNFGHTLGHFLETYTHYDRYLHGEAVLAGMDFAAFWSHQEGHLAPKDLAEVHRQLLAAQVVVKIPPVSKDRFLEIVGHDKKAQSQGVNFVALTALGSARIVPKVPLESLWQAYQAYLKGESPLILEEG